MMTEDDFRRDVRGLIERMVKVRKKREAMMVLAQLMQQEIQDYRGRRIPCRHPLEVLMRAVGSIIRSDKRSGDYIAEKWHYASRELPIGLKKEFPGFAKIMKRLEGLNNC